MVIQFDVCDWLSGFSLCAHAVAAHADANRRAECDACSAHEHSRTNCHFDTDDDCIAHRHFRAPSATPAPQPTLDIFPTGSFEATISEGTLTHTFQADGQWTATLNNHQMDTGAYTITGFQIAIFAGYCAKVLYDPIGTYDWSYEGETLTFKRALPDSCDTRTYFLARKHKLLP